MSEADRKAISRQLSAAVRAAKTEQPRVAQEEPSSVSFNTLNQGRSEAMVLALAANPPAGEAHENPIVQRRVHGSTIEYYDREILIVRRASADPRAIRNLLKEHNLRALNYLSALGLYRLEGPAGTDVIAVAAALTNSGLFEVSEPNYVARAATVPNDPEYDAQWNLQLIHCEPVWSRGVSANHLIAAVVDSGVDLDHSEFAGRLLSGHDFVNDDSDPDDDSGHGTNVAGILAAAGNNYNGIAGVMWDAQILPVKVMNSSNLGSYFNVASGITYAADNGAHVINLSLIGSSAAPSLQSAVTYAHDRNVMLFAAMGNSGTERAYYPAAFPETIAVASTRASDGLSSFSTTGSHATVAAPGDGIRTTSADGNYSTVSGTSIASPHAAAMGLFIQAAFPGISNVDAQQMMQDAAIDLGQPGHDSLFGWGRIDFVGILAVLSAPPDPPIEPDPPAVVDLAVSTPAESVEVLPIVWSGASSSNGAETAAQVSDGVDATQWTSELSPVNRTEYVLVDFGYEHQFNRMRLRRSDDPSLPMPLQIVVFSGTADLVWTMLGTYDGPAPDQDWFTFVFPDSVGQYVAIWVTQLGTDPLGNRTCSFAELAFQRVVDNALQQAQLTWSEPVDGPVASYEVLQSTEPITSSNAFLVDAVGTVPGNGSSYNFLADNLAPGTAYSFAIKSVNATGGWSLSNVAPHQTSGIMDTVAPSAISDLVATTPKSVSTMLPQPVVVSATSWAGSDTLPAASVDADVYSSWMPAVANAFRVDHIIYDLGGTYSVNRMLLSPQITHLDWFPEDFEIWTSLDNVTWERQLLLTGYSFVTSYNLLSFSFDPKVARYVGIQILRGRQDPNTGTVHAAIGEVEVGYGTVSMSNSATLQFTAVGDDGMVGTAARYEVLQSLNPIWEGGAAPAVIAPMLPSPLEANQHQAITVTQLVPGTTYHFGVRVLDEAGNASTLSTVVYTVPE